MLTFCLSVAPYSLDRSQPHRLRVADRDDSRGGVARPCDGQFASAGADVHHYAARAVRPQNRHRRMHTLTHARADMPNQRCLTCLSFVALVQYAFERHFDRVNGCSLFSGLRSSIGWGRPDFTHLVSPHQRQTTPRPLNRSLTLFSCSCLSVVRADRTATRARRDWRLFVRWSQVGAFCPCYSLAPVVAGSSAHAVSYALESAIVTSAHSV